MNRAERFDELSERVKNLKADHLTLRSDFTKFQDGFTTFLKKQGTQLKWRVSTSSSQVVDLPKSVAIVLDIHPPLKKSSESSPPAESGEGTSASDTEVLEALSELLQVPVASVASSGGRKRPGDSEEETPSKNKGRGLNRSVSPGSSMRSTGRVGSEHSFRSDGSGGKSSSPRLLVKNLAVVLSEEGNSDDAGTLTLVLATTAILGLLRRFKVGDDLSSVDDSMVDHRMFLPDKEELIEVFSEQILTEANLYEDSRLMVLNPDPQSLRRRENSFRWGTAEEENLLFQQKSTTKKDSPKVQQLRQSPKKIQSSSPPPPALGSLGPSSGDVSSSPMKLPEEENTEKKAEQETNSSEVPAISATVSPSVPEETEIATRVELVSSIKESSEHRVEARRTPPPAETLFAAPLPEESEPILPSSHKEVARRVEEGKKPLKAEAGVLPTSVYHQQEHQTTERVGTGSHARPRPPSQSGSGAGLDLTRPVRTTSVTYGAPTHGVVHHKWALPAVIQRWDLNGGDGGGNTGELPKANTSTKSKAPGSPSRSSRSTAGLTPARSQDSLPIANSARTPKEIQEDREKSLMGFSSATTQTKANLNDAGHQKAGEVSASSKPASGRGGNRSNLGVAFGHAPGQCAAPTIPSIQQGKQKLGETVLDTRPPNARNPQPPSQRGQPYRVPTQPTFTVPTTEQADELFIGASPKKQSMMMMSGDGQQRSVVHTAMPSPRGGPSVSHRASRALHAHQGKLSGMFETSVAPASGEGGAVGDDPAVTTPLSPHRDNLRTLENPTSFGSRTNSSRGGARNQQGVSSIPQPARQLKAGTVRPPSNSSNRGDSKTLNLIMREVKSNGASSKKQQHHLPLSSLVQNHDGERGAATPKIPQRGTVDPSVESRVRPLILGGGGAGGFMVGATANSSNNGALPSEREVISSVH